MHSPEPKQPIQYQIQPIPRGHSLRGNLFSSVSSPGRHTPYIRMQASRLPSWSNESTGRGPSWEIHYRKALLASPCPLDDIYCAREERESTHMEEIISLIEDRADSLIRGG